MSQYVQKFGKGTVYALALIGAASIFIMFGQHQKPVLGTDSVAIAPVAASVPTAIPQAAAELSSAFTQITEQAGPAVVFIRVEKEMKGNSSMRGFDLQIPDELRPFFNFPRQSPPSRQDKDSDSDSGPIPYGSGSGFIVDPNGYIITNNHVVADADRVKVKLNDGREFTAKVVGTDPHTEIAVIKIEATGLPTVPLGDSDSLKVGEWVLAIGSPFGLQHTVTAGIVSARGRGNVGITDYSDFIQTDAAINPGNSGGPLLNLNGQVVGMNTAIFSPTGAYSGVGFAIPVNMIKYISQQLRDKGSVSRGFLGLMIQDLTPELAKWFNVEQGKGVLVAEVKPGTPADKAGLKRDDLIVQMDGKPVTDSETFRSHVSTTPPGKELELAVLRSGQPTTVRVQVGTLAPEEVAKAETKEGPVTLGIAVQNMTDQIAQQLGYTGEIGVVVAEVQPYSPAAMAGIKQGTLIKEVNRTTIHNTDEFQKAIRAAEKGKPILFLIREGDGTRYVALSAQ